jgi:hypothetical protein
VRPIHDDDGVFRFNPLEVVNALIERVPVELRVGGKIQRNLKLRNEGRLVGTVTAIDDSQRRGVDLTTFGSFDDDCG